MILVSKSFQELSLEELYGLLKLRVDVFVSEQHRPLADLDGKDCHPKTLHLLGIEDGRIIAYVRVVAPGVSYPEVSIERVVVSQTHRKLGLGKSLMEFAIAAAHEAFPNQPITLHAQQYLEKFYNAFGFQRKGEIFLENGIPHVMMLDRPISR